MSIEEFFKQIKKAKCPKLVSEIETANDVVGFYCKCISNNLPKTDTIKQWHRLLKQYINDPDAIFFIRRYSSTKNKDGWNIRRGFLSIYPNVKYVFVDNFFAQYFFAMAINDFVPEYDDFKQFICERKIPYGYMAASTELCHQAYFKGEEYPLNNNGWKLSHVFSANENDYNFNYKSIVKSLFPMGKYEDYIAHEENGYPYWQINETVPEDNLKVIKAHFLRVVHPINYFITPLKKHQVSTNGINDIGEYTELISFIKEQLHIQYNDIYDEYKELILAKSDSTTIKYNNIGLSYGLTLINPTSKGKKSGNKPFSPGYIARCIKAFLFDGYSFRAIEEKILKLNHDAHGYVAKELINSHNIPASLKNSFAGQDPATAINEASEPLKSTIKWMYEHIDD